jgi:hypothetical protein
MNSTATDRLEFNTDLLPERDRFQACCEEVVRRYSGFDLRLGRESDFRGTIELKRVGTLNVGRNFTAPMDCIRTANYVRDGDDGTGKSFTQHVLERRLERAAALLRDPRWRHRRIADVAAEAGFTDLSYFNRAFRRRFGVTPSDVRQHARGHG